MKKIFTLLMLSLSTVYFAQNIAVFGVGNSGCVSSSTITNGGIFNLTTTASSSTLTPVVTVKKFNAQNLSASTVTLNVVRTIVYQSPNLLLDGMGYAPDTYFCWGSCFPSNIGTATISDWQVLGPLGTSSAPFDNTCANSALFTVDLAEGLTQGKYYVRYKVYNVNNPNDSLSFTVKYNEFLSVNEHATAFENVSEIQPNPTSTNASLSLSLNQENDVKVQVYNTLGALVYTSPNQKYAPGKHKISVDCNNFNTGLYFVTLTAGDSKITKRLVVNK